MTKVIAEGYCSVSLLCPTYGLCTPLSEFAMLFSHSTSYAIRALTYLAMQPPGKLTGTKEISNHEGIPNSFLGKVLIQLRWGRLVRSYKGIGGGHELALPPDRINLLMVVRCTDDEDFFEACMLVDPDCPRSITARCTSPGSGFAIGSCKSSRKTRWCNWRKREERTRFDRQMKSKSRPDNWTCKAFCNMHMPRGEPGDV